MCNDELLADARLPEDDAVITKSLDDEDKAELYVEVNEGDQRPHH